MQYGPKFLSYVCRKFTNLTQQHVHCGNLNITWLSFLGGGLKCSICSSLTSVPIRQIKKKKRKKEKKKKPSPVDSNPLAEPSLLHKRGGMEFNESDLRTCILSSLIYL